MPETFRTPLTVVPAREKIDHRQTGFLAGSCFAGHIGHKLLECRMPVAVNPLGTVYNPLSLVNLLRRLSEKTFFQPQDLFFHQGLYGTYHAHSLLSSPSVSSALEQLNQRIGEGADCLERSDYLILTLGTAWTYRLKSSGETVANCHRFPSTDFERSLLSVEEIVEALAGFFGASPFWKQKRIIFTVSPVRHLKEGFTGNLRSKARLILAVEQLEAEFPNASYFPAFELLNDDLRDYRFYERDRVHPSQEAIDYIWEHFCRTYFDPATDRLCKRIQKLEKAHGHRPFHTDSDTYRQFVEKTAAEKALLATTYPHIDFSK